MIAGDGYFDAPPSPYNLNVADFPGYDKITIHAGVSRLLLGHSAMAAHQPLELWI
jgi:hypothetical protein